jgi:hypothetical protein
MFSSTVHHLLSQEEVQPRETPGEARIAGGYGREGAPQVGFTEARYLNARPLQLLRPEGESLIVGDRQPAAACGLRAAYSTAACADWTAWTACGRSSRVMV